MTKKINSKLLISLCLVIVLIVCALSMMACNKKKGDSSNSTSVDVVTGETVIAIDNVKENKTVNITTSYTTISTSTYTKEASFVAKNGCEYWIVTDGTTFTIPGSSDTLSKYYIYDLTNDEYTYGPFTTYYISNINYNYNSSNYSFGFVYTARVIEYQNYMYRYQGQVVDFKGNYLSTTLTARIENLYYGESSIAFDDFHFLGSYSIDNTCTMDPVLGLYTTGIFYDAQGIANKHMILLNSLEVQPLDEDLIIPTFDTGNKYQEKTQVPGMSGYFYVIDRSILFTLF